MRFPSCSLTRGREFPADCFDGTGDARPIKRSVAEEDGLLARCVHMIELIFIKPFMRADDGEKQKKILARGEEWLDVLL